MVGHDAARAERRREVRLRSYLGGRITFNQRFSTMDCLVRNISDRGAKIVLSGQEALPDCFELEIIKRGARLQARIEWQRQGEIGLSFAPRDPVIVPLDLARRIKTLMGENAELKRRLYAAGETADA